VTFKPGDRVRNLWDCSGAFPHLLREATVIDAPPGEFAVGPHQAWIRFDDVGTLPPLPGCFGEDAVDDGLYCMFINELEKI
jgi:hypothetical protein